MCQPCLDRTLQRDIEEVATRFDHQPEIAHRGEAGFQRRAGIDRAAQCSVRGIVLYTVHRTRQSFRTAWSADQQVEFHVHQTGQQRYVAQIDVVVRILRKLNGIDRGDPVAVDHHHGR